MLAAESSLPLFGQFRASFQEVASNTTFELINEKKRGKRGYKNSGTFMVLKVVNNKTRHCVVLLKLFGFRLWQSR